VHGAVFNAGPRSGARIPTLPLFYWVATLASNLGQVVYPHCLPSLLSSNKLWYKKEFSDWTD